MNAHLLIGAVMFACLTTSSTAQTVSVPSTPPAMTSADSAFARAQRLVNEGRGVEGRAIVDSLFRIAPPGSESQAEALFWRATLATTAAEAERDYRQISVEHPLSRRAEDALLRLAQLELQRGDRTLALAHLDRLLREHGSGPARARGAYWAARVHFELNDLGRACHSLADARAALPASDVELRNQIDYAAQRCPALPLAVQMTTSAVASVPAPRPTSSATSVTPAATDTGAIRTTAPVPDTSSSVVADPSRTPAAPATAAVTPPAVIPPASTPARTPPARTAPPAAEPQRFSVQVAAYQTKADADRLVRTYRANGYDARTFGTVAPFRVRIGRFRTRAEAVELAKVLKAKSGAAFVVVAEPR